MKAQELLRLPWGTIVELSNQDIERLGEGWSMRFYKYTQQTIFSYKTTYTVRQLLKIDSKFKIIK